MGVDHGFKQRASEFPFEELLRDSYASLGLSAPKQEVSFYAKRIREHLSGECPSSRLARVLGRWRNFPFVLETDSQPCESGLAALAMHVRQLFDAIDEDDRDRMGQLETQVDEGKHHRVRAGRCQDGGWLTIGDVSKILDCSYSQARERMLDGRIKTYKDKKHIRTKREWVYEYVERQIVQEPAKQHHVKLNRQRRPKDGQLKPQGIGLKFLKNRDS